MCRTPATGTFFQTLFTLLFSFEIKLFIQDHDSSSADLPANLPVLLTKSSRTLLCIQKCGSNCTFLSTFRWQFSIDDTLPYLAINVSEWQILYVRNGFYTWSQWKISIFSLLMIFSKWTYSGYPDRWLPSDCQVKNTSWQSEEFFWLGTWSPTPCMYID